MQGIDNLKGGGVTNLSGLNDVSISSPSDGQTLKYNSTSHKWENASGGSGGSSVSWNQILQSGTKIAEVTINGTTQDVYAPSGGGGGGESMVHIYSTVGSDRNRISESISHVIT